MTNDSDTTNDPDDGIDDETAFNTMYGPRRALDRSAGTHVSETSAQEGPSRFDQRMWEIFTEKYQDEVLALRLRGGPLAMKVRLRQAREQAIAEFDASASEVKMLAQQAIEEARPKSAGFRDTPVFGRRSANTPEPEAEPAPEPAHYYTREWSDGDTTLHRWRNASVESFYNDAWEPAGNSIIDGLVFGDPDYDEIPVAEAERQWPGSTL